MPDDAQGARTRQSTNRTASVSPMRHQSSPSDASDVQQQILAQLQKLNSSLDTMEDEMAEFKRCTGNTEKVSSLSLAQKGSHVNQVKIVTLHLMSH